MELIDASIKHLKGQRFTLYPDFPTAGIIDVTNYNDGMRGGKVRVRAKISTLDKNTLVIKKCFIVIVFEIWCFTKKSLSYLRYGVSYLRYDVSL